MVSYQLKCNHYQIMKWVTRSHVHVDRVACPWLISRFIDSDAEFIFVPKSQVEQVAKETGAIPYDAPQVELGHKEGKCSFESPVNYRPKCATHSRVMWATRVRVEYAKMIESIVL
jgi:hypothetical protein